MPRRQALRSQLEKSNQFYWAARSDEQILAVSAWVTAKAYLAQR